jgi:hypothetical protein
MQLMGIAEFIIGRAFARPVGSTPSYALLVSDTYVAVRLLETFCIVGLVKVDRSRLIAGKR